MTKHPTVEKYKMEINSEDKDGSQHPHNPGSVPLGGDSEAAGHPITEEEVVEARNYETTPIDQRPSRMSMLVPFFLFLILILAVIIGYTLL